MGITRKLVGIVAAGVLLGFSGGAQASVLVTNQSTLGMRLGALHETQVTALPGVSSLVTLTSLGPNLGHKISVASTVWSTVNFGPGTVLFTGVPLISNLKVTVNNGTGVLSDNGNPGQSNPIGPGPIPAGFGGTLHLNGQVVVNALGGLVKLPVTLTQIGNAGVTVMASLAGHNITITNGPWVTAPVRITGVTSNFITIPARGNVQGVGFTLQPTANETVMSPSTNGGYASLDGGNPVEKTTGVSITGSLNLLSQSRPGSVTVVAPMRVDTGSIEGSIPGAFVAKFVFVPEPGTVLLLVSGAVGLAVIGRRRLKK